MKQKPVVFHSEHVRTLASVHENVRQSYILNSSIWHITSYYEYSEPRVYCVAAADWHSSYWLPADPSSGMHLHNETKIRATWLKKKSLNKTKSLPLVIYARIQISRQKNPDVGRCIAGIG